MYISRLSIENLRLIEKLEIEPTPRLNIIYGKNGEGKTSILEAIYLLVRNRSFRKTKTINLIRHQQLALNIQAMLNNDSGQQQTISLTKSNKGSNLILNYKRQNRLLDVAFSIPIGIIRPNIHKLIEDNPIQRRKLMDWGVFHVEQQYAITIKDYNHIVNQRNQSLKDNKKLFEIWDNQLIYISNQITKRRQENIEQLEKYINQYQKELFPKYSISIEYQKGWQKEMSYSESLKYNLKKDIQLGYTSCGPHRADMILKANGKPIKEIFSSGEIKLLGALLVISNLINIKGLTLERPILLCDDLDSEIDNINLQKIIDIIDNQSFQTFMTTIHEKSSTNKKYGLSMFHVEHGLIV